MRVLRGPGRRIAAVLLVSAGGSLATHAAAPQIPLETFAAGPEVESPRVSPDGSHLIFIVTGPKGERLLAARDLKSGKVTPVVVLHSGLYRGTTCEFKNDERLLCHFDGVEHHFATRPYPASRLVAVNRDGSRLKVLFQSRFYGDAEEEGPQFQDRIVHMLPADPTHVLIEMTDGDSVFPGVYRLDVESGAVRGIVSAHPPVMSWLADRDGVVRFGSGYRDKDAVYVARRSEKDPWQTLEKFKRFAGARFAPLAFGPLPNQLLVAAPQQRRSAVWEMDLDEHKDFELLFARPDVDARSIIVWPTDQHVTGFLYETDRPHVEFIDPLAAGIEQLMEKNVPDAYHEVIDASRDGTMLVIVSYRDVTPPVYHLLDLTNHKLMLIGQESSALAQAQLAPMKAVKVPGPGGVSIPGYLTLPVGTVPGQRIAAVVFPHGGPYARDSWGYDPLVQLMANRGYAVLQLNFRGSTGYGEDWLDAGHQAWGTVMHDDITAGTHWLIDQGIADPARVCIVGWSYGGYAALIGVVKEPQLYRCAVAIAGVSDLSQMASDEERFYGGRDAALNSTGEGKGKLQAESPALHADRIKVPVLLVHGEEDYTVLATQSKEMAKALTQHGVRNELVLIKDGEHSLLEPAMRLQLYGKLEAFLAQNLAPP
jgi:dipeptidyl aminopeptidase/acylaminoacyl peptidase